MSFPCLSPQRKPQSIIHKIGRLGTKVSNPFSKSSAGKREKLKRGKKGKKRHQSNGVPKSKSAGSLGQTTTSTVGEIEASYDSPDEFSDCNEDCNRTADAEIDVSESYGEDFFISLDQNEFLMECFLTNECSDVTFIVHFFAEDSTISEDIEDILLIRIMEAGSSCQCRRVNARLAPLFTAKLGIDPEQPTVVAIRNGAVIGRISDITSSACWELEKWITDTGILTQKAQGTAFSRMNTLSC